MFYDWHDGKCSDPRFNFGPPPPADVVDQATLAKLDDVLWIDVDQGVCCVAVRDSVGLCLTPERDRIATEILRGSFAVQFKG